MRINDVIGLLAALIGSTATLLGVWAYIRSQHPPRGKMVRVALAIMVIMVCILGTAVIISRATTIKVNGQNTLPMPFYQTPTPVPSTTPTLVPTSLSSPTPAPSPTQLPVATPVPSPVQIPVSTPVSPPTT